MTLETVLRQQTASLRCSLYSLILGLWMARD
jgi:hypothetical protein